MLGVRGRGDGGKGQEKNWPAGAGVLIDAVAGAGTAADPGGVIKGADMLRPALAPLAACARSANFTTSVFPGGT